MTPPASALRPLRGLRLDLSRRTCSEEELPADVARAYLGGRGLGAYLALRERLFEVEPFAPENLLIFAPGPLTGTGAPASGRYSVTSRSPLTGTVFDGNSGGNFGNALRRLGWDYLIVTGALDEPGYVTIGLDAAAEASPAGPRRAPGRRRRRAAAPRRRPLGHGRPRLARAPAGAVPEVRGRRHRPGRRARRAVREHRQQPRPLHRPRRPRRRDGRQAAQGARPRRTRRPQAAGRRPRAPRVHRLRGGEAAEGQPDHLDGAARVRHVGARQRARPGRRAADPQPPREPVRGRRGHLRRGAEARSRAAPLRLPRLHHRLRPAVDRRRRERRRPRVREHLGLRRRVRRERPHGDRAGQLRLQPRRHGHHHHGRDHRLRHGAHGPRPAAGRPALRRRAGHHRARRGHGRRRGPRRRARARLGALRRPPRPPRALDERQAARDAGLRPPRHEGPGPRLRHQQPRRLPPARQHARPRDPRRAQDGRPLRDARQGGPAHQPPEPERRARLAERLQVHRLRDEGGLLRPPAERRLGRDRGAAGAAAARRAHLERRAPLQPRRRLHARRRHAAAPAPARTRAGRAVRRSGSRLAADARRVLHLARLGRGRRALGGQARAPRPDRDGRGGGRRRRHDAR